MSGQEGVRLRPPQHQVSPRAISWWRWQLALSYGIPIAILVAHAVIFSGIRGWFYLPAIALALLAIVSILTLPKWWFRVHRWEVTDHAVYTRTGYFWQEWRVAPMSRIQTVDTTRGPLEQKFKLATVKVTTASARGAVTIAGLDAELAADLAAQLTETTQATPGDAT